MIAESRLDTGFMSPKIAEAKINELFPTQLTVGMIEVNEKEKALQSMPASRQKEFLQANSVPAVIGWNGNLYITDHHHLCRAAHEVGMTYVFILVEADLSSTKTENKFWAEMVAHKWVHPLDNSGTRHLYSSIPHHISHLVDDVYRSLVGYMSGMREVTKRHQQPLRNLFGQIFSVEILL